MTQNYTAVLQKSDGWWIGWIQEVNKINCQERTREALIVSLKSGLEDIEVADRLAKDICKQLRILPP